MATRMPPPGAKPSLVIAVGAKPPGGGKEPAPKPPAAAPPDAPEDEASEKMPPEKAMVIRDDQRCSNCENYHAEDGSCEEVEGQFSPTDACFVFYSPMDADEDDAGAEGGAEPQATPEDASMNAQP